MLTPLLMVIVLGMAPLSLPTTFVFLALPILGLAAGVTALGRMGVEGPEGLRLPALLGLGVNLLIVVTFVLNGSW